MDVTTAISPSEAGTILTVDLEAIVANWQTLRIVCGDAECGAVVKADAYGLGLAPVVKTLDDAGCKSFFVAHPFEGRAVRAVTPTAAIYVLNGMRPETAPLYADFNLIPVLCSVPEIEDYGQYCAVTQRRTAEGGLLPAALRLETGLNQLGLKPYDLEHGSHLSHLILPTVAIAMIKLPLIMRLLRSSLIEVYTEDYIDAARLRGVGETRILFRHALRNAAMPTVTLIGVQAAQTFGGSVLIEAIYGLPGLGNLMIGAIRTHDLPLIQGITLTYCAAVLLLNNVVDLAYLWLNPRLRAR